MSSTQSIFRRLGGPFAAVMLFGAAGIIAMVVALAASGGSSAQPKTSVRTVRPALATPLPSPTDTPLPAATAPPAPSDFGQPATLQPVAPTADAVPQTVFTLPPMPPVLIAPAPRHGEHGGHGGD